MTEAKLYPSLRQSIFLVLLLAFFQVIIAFVLGGFVAVVGLPLEASLLLESVGTVLAFVFVLLLERDRMGASLRQVFPLRHVRPLLYIPITLTVLGFTILAGEMDALLQTVLPMPDWLEEIFAEVVLDASLANAILAVVIVAPLTEEPFFRGLMLRGLRSRYSGARAVAIQALIFGIFHINPWQIVGAIPAGLIFGWWVVGTGSLIPVVYGHALANGLSLLLARALGMAAAPPGWMVLAAIPMTILGLWWLRCSFRGQGRPMTPPAPGLYPAV